MSGLLVNIDVDDLERATQFYCDALGLRVGRRFEGWTELVGAAAPIYLKAAGTSVSPKSASVSRATAAGASIEVELETHPYGRIAMLADPFGNGFCLLQFTGRGYDEIAQ